MPPRLITLTLNPALDAGCAVDRLVHTDKIRTREDHLDPGGGGINVARVVHELGGDTLAVMMGGGLTGALIEEMLNEAGVPHRNIQIPGRTRISFNVFEAATGLEYRFVQQGPEVAQSDWSRMQDALETIEGDWLVASGSLPRGLPDGAYADIANVARRRGQRFVLDTSAMQLRAALGNGITLIKPSLSELETLVGRTLPNLAAREDAALSLVRSGDAELVAVTLGAEGALLASSDGVAWQRALPCEVRSAVGAGDSFTGAMTLALARGCSLPDALRWGVAAGTAAVVRAGTARIRRKDVEMQYRRLLDTGSERPGA